MKNVNNIKCSLVAILAFSINACGGSGSNTQGTTPDPDFDSSVQMNLSELENYDLIAGDGSGATSLRSVSTATTTNNNDSTPDHRSLKLSNILKSKIEDSIQNAEESQQARTMKSVSINSDDIATSVETTNGNISGTQTINFSVNRSTGNLTGTMSYSNYKNSESNSCGGTEIDSLNGTMNVVGSFDLISNKIRSMTIDFSTDFAVGDMVWKSRAVLTIAYSNSSIYDEDSLMTMTIKATVGDEFVGFKNYKIRSYNDGGFEYSYPVEGNVYIFTDDINRYFSVDSTYDHSLTPTKEDWCGEYTYSGKEKYVGKNSTLTWSITSTNNYLIEIDSDADGNVDINVVGVIGE
jgi:hypothetical protein